MKPAAKQASLPEPLESELDRVDLGKPVPPPAALEPGAPQADPDVEFDMSDMSKEDCEAMARDGWDWAFKEIEGAGKPWLVIPGESKDRVVRKSGLVLYKHKDKLPDWFKKWRIELELGMAVGGIVVGAWMEYREAKAAADRTKKDQPNDAKPQEKTPPKPQPVADNVTRTA